MTYPFADHTSDHDRLLAQGALIDPLTRRFLQDAGLTPGMRVLDLGSGAGNVARLAADLVGPTGHVVGIDSDPTAVALAAEVTETDNVEYRVGDIQSLDEVDDGFDVVVGRLVLSYVADPVATLRRASARVRGGGLVCLHECDFDYLWVGGPTTPLWEQVRRWTIEALTKAGADLRLGTGLFTAYRAADLPDPRLRVEAIAAGGAQAPAWGWANVVAGMVPLMERFGIATRSEVEPTTLADRLLAETLESDSCVIGPLMTGASTRLPQAS